MNSAKCGLLPFVGPTATPRPGKAEEIEGHGIRST